MLYALEVPQSDVSEPYLLTHGGLLYTFLGFRVWGGHALVVPCVCLWGNFQGARQRNRNDGYVYLMGALIKRFAE